MTVKRKTRNDWTGKAIKIIFVILVLIPIIFLSSGIIQIQRAIGIFNKRYTDDCAITLDEFMDSDPERCKEYVEKYEQIHELYHIPFNLTGDGWDYYIPSDIVYYFNPANYPNVVNGSTYLEECDYRDTEHPLNTVGHYTNLEHAEVGGGYYGVGEALRYAIAQRERNQTAIDSATEMLLKIVKGYSILSEFTEDGSMVRYIAPNTTKGKQYISNHLFQESYSGPHNRFSITAEKFGKEYTFYAVTGTSVDCYHAVYGALGFIYLMCNNTEIRSIVRNTIDRMLTFHVNVGWRFQDHDGKSHSMGAEAIQGSPAVDSMYVLTFLRVGKTVHPEKWGALYDKYAYNRMFLNKCGKHMNLKIQMLFVWGPSYFNVNLPVSLAGMLTFLEDDPQLKRYYQIHFLEVCHDITKYHRNAWFDVLYYLGMSEVDYQNYNSIISIPDNENIDDYWESYVDKCVGDTLTRMTYTKFPYRCWYHAYSMESYDSNPNFSPVPGASYPEQEYWYWEEDPEVPAENWAVKLVTQAFSPIRLYPKAVPMDWRDTDGWVYAASPFLRYGGQGNGNRQPIAAVYTVPYWIARYLDLPCVSI
ncbi:MAG: hypothetical protein GF364_21500 [Candidatus Lokiarchaeota archaeon]|nr:hypothetical protein [Candidatus Lokiarchaeota archaeon]